jgi:hypothetical protein
MTTKCQQQAPTKVVEYNSNNNGIHRCCLIPFLFLAVKTTKYSSSIGF